MKRKNLKVAQKTAVALLAVALNCHAQRTLPVMNEWADLEARVEKEREPIIWIGLLYPPGLNSFIKRMGLFGVGQDVRDVLEKSAPPQIMCGVPSWTLRVVEKSGKFIYTSDGVTVHTAAVPPYDAREWSDQAYALWRKPPENASVPELDEWYAKRSRERMEFEFTLIPSDLLADYFTNRAEEARAARALNPPEQSPTRGLVSIDDDKFAFTQFAVGNGVYHFGALAGSIVVKAYTNDLVDLLFTTNLNAYVGDCLTITNIPVRALSKELLFDIPFAKVPQADTGFFRLLIPDDGYKFYGITSLWLAKYGLLEDFYTNPATAFFNVYCKDNKGNLVNSGMNYIEFFLNGYDPNFLPPQTQASNPLNLPFRIYGDYAAWTMMVRGKGPTDNRVFVLSTAVAGMSDTRTLSLQPGNMYEITMIWNSSITGTYSGKTYYWYCWEARVDNKPTVRTYNDYNPNRIANAAVNILGPKYFIENAGGLLTTHIHMNNNPGQNSYGGGGNIAGNQKATLYALNAIFTNPSGNPRTAPQDAGIGQNQFTYSTNNVGVLTIDFMVKMDPPGTAAKIAPHCQFVVEKIGNNPGTWVTGKNGVPTASGDYLCATVTFTNLPAINNDFGWKTVKILYDGQELASQQYGVFFPRDVSNHKQPCNTCVGCPNWYYYWRQGQVCGIPATCVYDVNYKDFGYTHVRKDIDDGLIPFIRLGADAPNENIGPYTFHSDGQLYGSITTMGTGKGIQCTAEVILHEQDHIDIYYLFWGQPDGDGDRIPDAHEATFRGVATDPNNPDTFNVDVEFPGLGYNTNGDQDIRCQLRELDMTITLHPERDWANPGCQHKNQWGPQVPR